MNILALNMLLDRIRAVAKENQWVEFKENNTGAEAVGKRISALANSACLHAQQYGYLVFGIADESKAIVGTEKHFSELKRGKEELEHWIIQRLNPRIDFRVYDFFHDSSKISIIQIPAAVAQPVRFMQNAYIRIGSITRKLNEFPDKERKIWQSTPIEKFEHQIAHSKVAMSKLNAILSFETYFELLKLPIPTRLDDMIQRFEAEKLIIRSGDTFNITNLGAILFAKNLEPFEELRRKSIRLIAYEGTNRLATKKEYEEKRGYAVAFSPILRLLDAFIPVNEVIQHALRTNIKLYPDIALRELIANALIHQDFSIGGSGTMIEVFKDRIEISNPGKPIIDVLRFIDHHPRSRNERLAHFMRRLNFCEERGSGIDKVIAACEAHQLPAPDFIDGNDYTRAIIYAPRPWKKMSKEGKIRACYQHCTLKYISGEYMTNSTLRKRFNIEEKNYTTASRVIADTAKSNLIKDSNPMNKSRKHAKYIPFWAS